MIFPLITVRNTLFFKGEVFVKASWRFDIVLAMLSVILCVALGNSLILSTEAGQGWSKGGTTPSTFPQFDLSTKKLVSGIQTLRENPYYTETLEELSLELLQCGMNFKRPLCLDTQFKFVPHSFFLRHRGQTDVQIFIIRKRTPRSSQTDQTNLNVQNAQKHQDVKDSSSNPPHELYIAFESDRIEENEIQFTLNFKKAFIFLANAQSSPKSIRKAYKSKTIPFLRKITFPDSERDFANEALNHASNIRSFYHLCHTLLERSKNFNSEQTHSTFEPEKKSSQYHLVGESIIKRFHLIRESDSLDYQIAFNKLIQKYFSQHSALLALFRNSEDQF